MLHGPVKSCKFYAQAYSATRKLKEIGIVASRTAEKNELLEVSIVCSGEEVFRDAWHSLNAEQAVAHHLQLFGFSGDYRDESSGHAEN